VQGWKELECILTSSSTDFWALVKRLHPFGIGKITYCCSAIHPYDPATMDELRTPRGVDPICATDDTHHVTNPKSPTAFRLWHAIASFCLCKSMVLNLSCFVAHFQRLSTLVAPCSSIGFCNITPQLFSKGLSSWPPENRTVASKGCRGPDWETLV